MNINLVAKKAGVSVATVSRVVNHSAKVRPQTRRKVTEVLESLEYSPMRRENKRVATIGITRDNLIPGAMEYEYCKEILAGVMEAAAKYKAAVRLLSLTDFIPIAYREGAYKDYLGENKIDALVHLLIGEQNTGLIERIADDGIRQVVIERRFDRNDISWIGFDNYGVSFHLGRYLASHGCRDFAVVTAGREFVGHSQRRAGFLEALKESGCEIPSEWDIERQLINPQAGYSATLNLCLPGKTVPRVIYYTNIELALGGIKALKEKNLRIPQDVIIATVDDSHLSDFLGIPMICLKQPNYQVGMDAVHYLMTQEEDPVCQKQITPEMFIPHEVTGVLA